MNKWVSLDLVYNSKKIPSRALRHRKWLIYKYKLTLRDANFSKNVIA